MVKITTFRSGQLSFSIVAFSSKLRTITGTRQDRKYIYWYQFGRSSRDFRVHLTSRAGRRFSGKLF